MPKSIKKYRNNYKKMSPNTAKHIGREMLIATMSDASASTVNTRLREAGVRNPDGTAVLFTDSHLSQMKAGIRGMLQMVQDKAPHRFEEAVDLVVDMHTGGAYGPWYRKWYIPHALETGRPLWVSSAEAHAIVSELRAANG